MASNFRRPSHGEPQIEALREVHNLSPDATPVSGLYDPKRSDFVERPHNAGSGLERLAQALSEFNPILRQMSHDQGEKFKEEQTAIGKELMDRNKKGWNEFVAANQEYAGLNPHLERGYKSAELNAKGRDFDAAAQNYYTTSGLANETDPVKVREALNAFGKTWTAENVKAGEYDANLYAEHYLKFAQHAEGAILSRHTKDRADEHLRLADEKFSHDLGSYADSVLNSTPNITNPDVFAKASDTIAQGFIQRMADMESTGMPRSRAHGVVMDSVIKLAIAEGKAGHGEELLALAEKIPTGTGTLGGLPTFKVKAKQIRDSWKDEARKERSEHIQMWHFNKAVRQENATSVTGRALMEAYKNKQPMPEAATLLSLPGVGPEHVDVVNSVRNAFVGATTHRVVMDQSTQAEFMADLFLAKTGKLTPLQAIDRLGRYGMDHVQQLQAAAFNASDGNTPEAKALNGMDWAAPKQILASQIQAREAAGKMDANVLNARIAEYSNFLFDEVSRYAQDETAKGRTLSTASLNSFARKAAIELGKEAQARDLGTSRDIRTPDTMRVEAPHLKETRQRALETSGTPAPKSVETKPVLGDETQAQAVLSQVVTNSQQAREALRNRYGLQPEQMDVFIAAQFKAYRFSPTKLAHKIKQKQHQEQAENFMNAAHGLIPKEEHDPYSDIRE